MSKDKIKHVVFSVVLVLLIALFFHLINTEIYIGAVLGIAFGIGVLKEFICDKLLDKGKLDFFDIVFNFVGCAIGGIFLMFL